MTDAVAKRDASPARDRAGGMRWSPPRVAGALVLAAWAGLFWFLLISGRDAFYLSTRTEWVVPVAAVLLSVAAIGRIASAKAAVTERLRRGELAVLAAMVVPVLLVIALPPATLGTFSADKRGGLGAGFGASAEDIGSGTLTLVDVASGQTSDEGTEALAARAGETVSFVGVVTRYADTPADEFLLTRYVVSCCVADATVAQVRVVNVTPGAFENGQWVEVKGTILPLGREVFVLAASSGVVEVDRPERPYLTF